MYSTTRTRIAQAKSDCKLDGRGGIAVRIERDPDGRTPFRTANGPAERIGTTSVEITIQHPSWAMGELRVHEVAEGNHMDPAAPNYYDNDVLRFSFTTPDRGANIMRRFAENLEAAAAAIREAVGGLAPETSSEPALNLKGVDVAAWQARTGILLN